MHLVLDDTDIRRILKAESVVAIIERALLAKANGTLISPPRFGVHVQNGGLLFTAGAETAYSKSLGFRVYDTFVTRSPEQTQVVAVFDSETGFFRGLVLGDTIGAWRTAAINAIAIKYMAPMDARRLGILGSGFQARFHLQAALAVRSFSSVKVYSPTASKRQLFAEEMGVQTGRIIETAPSAEEVIDDADVLICATKSSSPIFEPARLRPGMHVNTIGPKLTAAHEISPLVAKRSQLIATDSLAQVNSFSAGFFISDEDDRNRMVDLSDIIAGKQAGRSSPTDLTLFCSVGLAGTEVVLANEALRLAKSVSE
jgi:ornithine cyclodeaminase